MRIISCIRDFHGMLRKPLSKRCAIMPSELVYQEIYHNFG